MFNNIADLSSDRIFQHDVLCNWSLHRALWEEGPRPLAIGLEGMLGLVQLIFSLADHGQVPTQGTCIPEGEGKKASVKGNKQVDQKG